jgi:2-polyprenyl-3-methyl-5-hydroxy-6-metoxy-1,4-benzoquinol methylase
MKDLHKDLVFGYNPQSPIINLYKEHLAEIVRWKPPPAHLLEIGCARGVFSDLASQKGYHVTGTEVSAYACHYAKEKFNLDVRKGKIEDIPLEPRSFDIVVALDVLEHVPDPGSFIKKASGLLKPQGIFLLGTPTSRSPLYFLAENMAVLTQGRYSYPAYRFYGRGQEHLNIFNAKNLKQLLKENSLQVIQEYGYNIPLDNMCDVNIAYKCAIKMLTFWPYEFVMISVKS